MDFQFSNFKSRSKKSVAGAANAVRDFFGDILVMCCRVMTYRDGKKIVNNQESLATSYNIMREAMIDDHKNLFRVNEIINEMNTNLERQTKEIKNKFKLISKSLENMVTKTDLVQIENEIHEQNFFQNVINTISLETSKIANIMATCKNHKISQSMISKARLQELSLIHI